MKKYFIVGVFLFVSAKSLALTLPEKKKFKEWVDYLNDPSSSSVQLVKEKCGYEISAKIEESFVTPFMKENANAASYCDEVRSQISSMCSDSVTRDAIKAKVKKISCVYSSNPSEVKLEISSDTLKFSFGTKASNISDKTKEFLENNL